MDYTVIRYSTNYAARGRNGRYLNAYTEDSVLNPETNPTATAVNGPKPSSKAQNKLYLLGIDGQGIGEPIDCIQFVNLEANTVNKENSENAPIKYGTVIAIKSPWSKERLLGIRDGSKLGFWRHVVGQGEKWMILKANSSYSSSASLATPWHYSGTEDVSARGSYVRMGDSILFQTFKSEHFLSIHEHSLKEEIRLIYRERTGLGSEVWQLEMFGAVPLPSWYQTRPYLR